MTSNTPMLEPLATVLESQIRKGLVDGTIDNTIQTTSLIPPLYSIAISLRRIADSFAGDGTFTLIDIIAMLEMNTRNNQS